MISLFWCLKKITRHYVDVPPELIIEVDVKVELEGTGIETDAEFIELKTRKVFEFGVKKLIWILSLSKKVIIAQNGKPQEIYGWDKDLELFDGILFNIADFLKEEGIRSDI